LRTLRLGARAFVPAAIAATVLITAAPPAEAEAAEPSSPSEAAQIIRIAKAQLGDPWRYGAVGPSSFDCSGLVIYAYRQAGDYAAIGSGRYRGGTAMYRYFQRRGLASRSNPKPGDIVVWGGGRHVGIYIGSGLAISTLTRGVRIHRVNAVTLPFTAYLHTGMSGSVARPAPRPSTSVAAASGYRWTVGTVNFRRGPGLGSRKIGTLAGGTRLAVLGTGSDRFGRRWYHVRAGSRVGWVAGWVTR
jgi:hypothetical protein